MKKTMPAMLTYTKSKHGKSGTGLAATALGVV
jgi:hypothetical protein